MFALVDANSFYCSAEQVFNPAWRGKPIIVLSNNDGCIVAANKQAVALGIQKFEPYFKAKALCDKHGIIVCSSNYELYADLSHKMMQIIGRFAPLQSIYSIDESFLSFADTQYAIPNLALHAQQIRQAVWKEIRLPVCVGIGNTLTLAKVANHVSKKWLGFNGVCVLEQETFKQQVFKQLAPIDVWGIGRKTSKKLQENGINTVQKLCQTNIKHLPVTFTVELERTIKELDGQACKDIDQVRADKEQIFSTRSTGQRITDRQSLNQALAKHATIVASKARKQQSLCSTFMAFAANSPHDKHPVSYKILKQFTPATNDTAQFLKAISHDIDRLYKPGVAYYKIGVGLLNLRSEKYHQWDLFSANRDNVRLMNVLDHINQQYGRDSIFFAAQGIDQKWSMRRDLLTPQYTTNWQHIPKINC